MDHQGWHCSTAAATASKRLKRGCIIDSFEAVGEHEAVGAQHVRSLRYDATPADKGKSPELCCINNTLPLVGMAETDDVTTGPAKTFGGVYGFGMIYAKIMRGEHAIEGCSVA
jgi:hypothetical protein